MNIIGVTGNSGSGKSTVSRIIKEKLNAYVIDADKVAKELMENKTEYFNKICELFGREILDENENIDRKKLANIIFSNLGKRESLNEITYKYVVDEIKSRLANSQNENVVIDAPLLFESNLNIICTKTIAVLANEDEKINRIIKRDNISLEDAKKRLNSQRNDEFYIEKSDFLMYNNKDIQYIENQITNFINKEII